MSKKELLANLLYTTRAYRISQMARLALPPDLKILAYHRICDTDAMNDPELVSATRSDFEWQVAHIRQHYVPMTFADVFECKSQGQKLPRNAVVITFDDGFADNYVNAYDILQRFEVPATFFITTRYIGTNRTFWFNELSRTVMGTRAGSLRLDSDTFTVANAREDRIALLERLLQLCKAVPDSQRRKYLESISAQLGDPGECDPLSRPMTWGEVIEMSRNGMEFGSHSETHPILSRLEPKALRQEIHGSKTTIEEKLGSPVLALAYPVGGKNEISPQVLEQATKAGYRFGVSYLPGNNRGLRIGDLMLKRLHVERYTTRPMFAAMLALPEVLS